MDLRLTRKIPDSESELSLHSMAEALHVSVGTDEISSKLHVPVGTDDVFIACVEEE